MRFGKSNKAVTKANLIILLIVSFLLFAVAMPLMAQTKSATNQERDSLIKKLRDPDEKVRQQAAWALGVHRDRTAVPPLIAALKDTNGEVRASAAGALGDIGDKRAVTPLIAALKDTSGEVRARAADALGYIRDKRAVIPLIDLLKDPDRIVRASAAGTLGELGDKAAVMPLIAVLKDPDPSVRASTAGALRILGDKTAVRPLIAALKDPNPSVRASAAGALGRLGDKAAVPPLVTVMKKDPEKDIRCQALRALEDLKYKIPNEHRWVCEVKVGSAGPGDRPPPPPPPPSPLDPKGSDKIAAFWNTWFENRDEKTRVEVLEKDATYTFVLDISKYPYFSDSKAEPDPSVIKSIDEAHKQGKSSIRFRIRPILHGGFLRFTDNQRAWEELKVDISKLVLADKATEDNNEKKKDKLSSGEIKLQDFAHEVQAGEVRFDLLAERSGDATILITIWDEKGMIPLDHLSLSVRVIDESTPTTGQGPVSGRVLQATHATPSAAGRRTVSDTVPLRKGRQTLLNISSDFSTAGPLIADAAFYIFEKSPKDKSIVLFAAKMGDAAPGAPDEVSVYAWETVSLLSNYIEDRLQLIKLIRDARQRATSIDENVRKYSYQEAAKELKEKIFSGLNERDQKQAAAAEKVFRDLVRQKDRRSIVFARMRNEDGDPVYLPLGLLAANSSSRILDKRIILVQPLPRERYPAETHPVHTWTFNVPKTLPELEDATNTALGKLQQNPPYRRDIAAVRTYFEETVSPASGASPEGVILLSHQGGGNLWFTNDADRITTEKMKRQFPAGSVAILSACSAAASEGNNQAILERLNSNGIDAMIISPFPVDAEYGAMLAIQFVQTIENAKKNSQAFSVAELFSTASEQTAKHFKEKQKINFEDMDLEFLIAGDYRIRIAPK